MLDVLPMFGGSTKVAEPPQFWLSREPEGNAHEILAGGSFTLRVRLSGEPESNLLAKLGVVEPAEKRIGISVSFPSLTESSSSWDPDEVDFKSPVADIKSNTWPRDEVSFYTPGATIHDRENNIESIADYLLVELDRVATADEIEDGVELVLFIYTRRVEGFPILIRGWVCAQNYTGCSQQPTYGSAKDQQGWFVEEVTLDVTADEGFIATNEGNGFSEEIYIRAVYGGDEIDLGRRIQLTDNLDRDRNPVFSPDGRRIAFQSDRDDPDQNDDDFIWNIYSMNLDGSDVIRLTHDKWSNSEPSWSPDGQRIAFVSWQSDASDIYVMNADGSDLSRVTHDETHKESHPSWAPDGRSLAFQRSTDHGSYICVTTLVENHWSEGDCSVRGWDPSWSPTGDRIAFARDNSSGFLSNWDVFVMSPGGTRASKLIGVRCHDSDPSWSPDGRRIVFESSSCGMSFDSDSRDIYVVNAYGSDLRELGTDGRNPSWSPAVQATPSSDQ